MAQLIAMDKTINQQYHIQAGIGLRIADYDRLLNNPPTNKKGRIDHSKWTKSKNQAKEIEDHLLGRTKYKLTRKSNKTIKEINELISEQQNKKARGEVYDDNLWRSKLVQLQQP